MGLACPCPGHDRPPLRGASPETVEFVLAALALVPLAWLIGEATEQAAHHTGPGIGGFLNATFGNAPELIIALLAVNEGLPEVVRGSLTGSVSRQPAARARLLAALRRPGRARPRVELPLARARRSAVAAVPDPVRPELEGDPERHSLAVLSIPVAIVLLVALRRRTWFSLRRHRLLHVDRRPPTRRLALRLGAGRARRATVVTALVAEILVGSLEAFARPGGLSEFFVSAVIVAIVGNRRARRRRRHRARGKIKLAAEIALASSAQVAVFLIPAVALLSWLIDPLALSFRPGRDRRPRRLDRARRSALSGGDVQQPARRDPDRCLRRRRDDVLHRRRPAEARAERRRGRGAGRSRIELLIYA